MTKDEHLKFQTLYYDLLTEIQKNNSSVILLHEQYKIDSKTAMGPQWLLFYGTAEGYIRVIINELDQFSFYIASLDAWQKVLLQCDDQDKFNLLIETIYPLASYVINYVYPLKNRFVFTSCMLLHHTYILVDTNYKDSDLKEKNINYKTLMKFKEKFANNNYNFLNLNLFLKGLKSINDETYKKKTKEYRDRFQHRMPANIELGLSGILTRHEEDGSVSYGIGGEKPISLSEILPILITQNKACFDCFEVFWGFLQELLNIWKGMCPYKWP